MTIVLNKNTTSFLFSKSLILSCSSCNHLILWSFMLHLISNENIFYYPRYKILSLSIVMNKSDNCLE